MIFGSTFLLRLFFFWGRRPRKRLILSKYEVTRELRKINAEGSLDPKNLFFKCFLCTEFDSTKKLASTFLLRLFYFLTIDYFLTILEGKLGTICAQKRILENLWIYKIFFLLKLSYSCEKLNFKILSVVSQHCETYALPRVMLNLPFEDFWPFLVPDNWHFVTKHCFSQNWESIEGKIPTGKS